MSAGKQGGISTALFAMVFAVCFGSVGAFATWVMASTLIEGYSAREWVRVKANVTHYSGGKVAYHYLFDGREYSGSKMGVGLLEGSEVDDEIDARLTAASSQQTPTTVFVNPADPRESVVDPSIPWQLMLFMIPFALGFGGVGLGALVVAGKVLVGGEDKPAKTTVQTAGSGAGFLWIFAFFWNSLAFPIAAIAVPEMIRTGEWVGLLILIFPLVGLLVLWGAISTTLTAIRLGRAQFHLQNAEPRLGGSVSGFFAGKRFKAGDTYRVKLSCVTDVDSGNPLEHWSQDKTLRVTQAPQGERLSFAFDTPERLPAAAGERGDKTRWRIEVIPQGAPKAAYTFYFDMLPPLGAELDADDDEEDEEAFDLDEQPVPAGIPKGLEGIAAFVGKERVEERLESMSRTERAQLHARLEQLTPGQKQALEKFGKYAHYGPLVKKLVIAAIVLFVLVQVAGGVSMLLLSD